MFWSIFLAARLGVGSRGQGQKEGGLLGGFPVVRGDSDVEQVLAVAAVRLRLRDTCEAPTSASGTR